MKKLGFKVMCVMFLAAISLVLVSATVLALETTETEQALPWEGPMQRILDSIRGPVAKAIGVIAIVATGLGLAFGEGGGGFRKMLQIVFGLSIAFSASSFFLGFFNFSAGCAF